jgi:PAS domain S-box-containing protein
MSRRTRDEFVNEIEVAQHHQVALHACAGTATPEYSQLLEETFVDLHPAREELSATEGELFQQNTELIAMQEAVAAERRHYQDLFEFAPDGYLVTDTAGTIQEANRAAATLCSISQPCLVGKPLAFFVVPDDQPAFSAALAHLQQAHGIQEYAMRLQPLNGAPVDVALRVAPVQDRHDRMVGLRWLLRDITEHKRAEAARVAELRQLSAERQMLERERRQSLEVLAGGIAHDFNNLLMIILGNTALALEDLPPTSQIYRNLEAIQRASSRAATLTQQMLIYVGQASMQRQAVDLTRIAQEIIAEEQTTLPKEITLHTQFAPHLPPITADVLQVRQVVKHAIHNAVEAIGEQAGTITISTGLMRVLRTDLTATALGDDLPAGSYVTLEVVDTGPGMDAATQARICEPFFTTKGLGRGLGLAAVQGMLHRHGGMIQIRSEPGTGTVVRLCFPVAVAVSEAPASPATSTSWCKVY